MKIVIDAWLERKDPQIRFLGGDTAAPVMHWGTALTRHLMERGELNLDELRSCADAGVDALHDFLAELPGVSKMDASR